MNVNEIVLEGLRETRRRLVDQRGQLDEAIAEMDKLIAQRGAPLPSRPYVPLPTVTLQPRQVTITEAILSVLAKSDVAMRAADVASDLEGHGWAEASVRKTLAAMATGGLLRRPDRGLYEIATTSGDTALTVSPDSVPTEWVGGDADAAPPAEIDDHDFFTGREASDHNRETDNPVAIQF